MKKRIIVPIISLLLVLGVFSVCAGSNYSIKLGNEIVTMQYPVLLENDRIFVSVRNLCDLLGIPVYWNDEKNEVHIDIYNKNISVSDKTILKKEGVIPDEETALCVGKAILEKYMNAPLEYETEDKTYYLEVSYSEEYNSWIVSQTFDYKDGSIWVAGDMFYVPTIIISKDTGEVLHINTYSLLD